jgi:phosphoribosylformimino-5-aminoimidazole carboxamide ribotide isomerase
VWGSRDAAAIARAAFAKGVTRFLVLDLARVGTGAGPPLEAARAVEKPLRAVDLLVGGGIRSVDDLRALALAGVRGALLASALHSGGIDRAAVEEAVRLG